MTGRTCQLCGKPLSRFTVGSGGDFCSREHRNQFRLRLGMDRLQEANKIASLMRRRENPKAFPAALLVRDSKVAPRVAPHIRVPVRGTTVYSLPPLAAALELPRISVSTRNPMPATAPARSIHSSVRPLDAAEPFPVSLSKPLLPMRAAQFPAHLNAAEAVQQRVSQALAKPHRREVATMAWSPVRTHIGGNGIQIRAQRRNYREVQKPRQLASSADGGRELRISAGIGFRPPKTRLRRVTFNAPRNTPLIHATGARDISMPSGPKNGEAREETIRISARGVFGPTPPAKNGAVHFQWPTAVVPGGGFPRQTTTAPRTSMVVWTAGTPVPPQFKANNGTIRFSANGTPAARPSTPMPHGIHSVHRVTLVAFQPQETPFQYSPATIHGTLVSGMQLGLTVTPKSEAPAAPVAPVTLEEHFDAGLQQWLGETNDWKVDVAGVRAGSLAIYSPSLDVDDYVMEFLTRIESRSVNWVIRAADFNEYYHASLAVATAGGYEFRRQAVIAGVAEELSVRPVVPTSSTQSTRTAVTLRTRVVGDTFTVYLDGQVIDTWTDSRLATGGIGFLGAPDERARLYWVKLTPLGPINKENSKQ